MRKKEILTLVLMGWGWIFCSMVWAVRHKKLPPLTPAQVIEVVQKLKAGHLNCALNFDLKTTDGKKIEIKEGKLFAQQNGNETSLRFDFGEQSFWAQRKPDSEVFRFEIFPPIGLDDLLLPGHLLNFSDILMPFLYNSVAEYRDERRVQGRNVYIIRFREANGRCIDAAYDPKFEVILQLEYFNGQGNLTRTFKLLNFKKAQNEWFMKSIEIRDIASATTTQLTVKKVAIGQPIPPSIFDINPLEKSAELDLKPSKKPVKFDLIKFNLNILKKPVKVNLKPRGNLIKFNVNILKKPVKVDLKLPKKTTEDPLIYIDF
jgi:hypothetical protein